MGLRESLPRAWQRRGAPAIALLPLAALFCLLARLRRLAYRRGWLPVERLAVPVVVVGNVTVGGSGKTPLVAALVAALRRRGRRPGIVARGYGARVGDRPRRVSPEDDPATVGDEPLLLARRTSCPVVVHPDRVWAARVLVEEAGCDRVVADDGLQHYRLGRDVEIAVVDGRRGLGNGWCLPAGPLREPPSRLGTVDAVVTNGGGRGWSMELEPGAAVNLASGERRPLSAWAGQAVEAVAGIGDPARFFATLEAAGIRPHRHAFPDHHGYRPGELDFPGDRPLLMTEKDAVKCRPFAGADWWFVPVEARVAPALIEDIVQRLEAHDGQEAARDPGVSRDQGAADP